MSRIAALEKMRRAQEDASRMSESLRDAAAEMMTLDVKRILAGDYAPVLRAPCHEFPRASAAPGFIYCVRAGRLPYAKIGFSRMPVHRRIEELQIGCPLELLLIGVIRGSKADEKRLHADFTEHRVRGEWFRITPELRRLFKRGNR